MLDIGLGELLLMAVLALLVFGPERLPKVASDAARTLRQVRRMATEARRDLADAAGIEGDPELTAAVRGLRDLDPRRVLEPLDDDPAPAPPSPPARPAPTADLTATGARAAVPTTPNPGPVPTPGAVVDPPAPPALAPIDPDWT